MPIPDEEDGGKEMSRIASGREDRSSRDPLHCTVALPLWSE
jgi:hypothetical protein